MHRFPKCTYPERRFDLEHVSIVPQDNGACFPATVRDNIRYGRPDDGRDVIRRRDRGPGSRFIRDMPITTTRTSKNGVSTFRAARNSAVAIARALVANHSILILDDATSAVRRGNRDQNPHPPLPNRPRNHGRHGRSANQHGAECGQNHRARLKAGSRLKAGTGSF